MAVDYSTVTKVDLHPVQPAIARGDFVVGSILVHLVEPLLTGPLLGS